MGWVTSRFALPHQLVGLLVVAWASPIWTLNLTIICYVKPNVDSTQPWSHAQLLNVRLCPQILPQFMELYTCVGGNVGWKLPGTVYSPIFLQTRQIFHLVAIHIIADTHIDWSMADYAIYIIISAVKTEAHQLLGQAKRCDVNCNFRKLWTLTSFFHGQGHRHHFCRSTKR